MIVDFATAIALGVQGDKYRKEFRKQANLYRPAFETLANNLGPTIAPLVQKAGTVANVAALVGCSLAFAHVAVGCAALYTAYAGAKAQSELTSFYTKLGKDVEAMKNSLQEINDDVRTLVSHKAQHKFPSHVYDFVKMRGDQIGVEQGVHYLFVYHHGNEWLPAFHRLNTDAPLPHLAGIFNNLDIMAAYLQVFRNTVGEKPVFHILMPATGLYMVSQPVDLPQEIGPIFIEGELHNGTGLPYNYLNIPNMPPESFHHIRNLAFETSPPKPSPWKKVASTSAAWGTGLPAAITSSAGGWVLGCVGAIVLLPAAAPIGLIAGVAAGTGVVAGAVSGTVTGKYVGKKVEESFEK